MINLPEFLDEEISDQKKFNKGVFNFGSLTTLLHYTNDLYRSNLEFLYRNWLVEFDQKKEQDPINANLYIFESSEAFSKKYHSSVKPVILDKREEGWIQIRSDYVDAYIDLSTIPIKMFLLINPNTPSDPNGKPGEPLLNFMLAVVNKVLFQLGQLHVHGAGLQFNNTISLFIGDKGAGKTTLSLKLAHAGGEILSEDHIMIKQVGETYFASGCDDIMRITKNTEDYFFSDPIMIKEELFDGVPKKEIILSDYFNNIPYQDFPITNIFFPRVGQEFLIEPLRGIYPVLYFLERIQPRHRFADKEDINNLLSYLIGLFENANVFLVNLSDDLNDLDKLIDFLSDIRQTHKWKMIKKFNNKKFELSEGVSYREIEGEILIFSPNIDDLFTLNPVGEIVWDGLVKKILIEDIAQRISIQFEVSLDQAKNDTEEFILELLAKELIHEEN